MSPIASLRNRHYSNTVGTTDADNTIDLAQFPPSFRISRSYVTNNRLRYRGNKGKPIINEIDTYTNYVI